MKVFNSALAFLFALTLTAGLMPNVAADQGESESITVTIDRRIAPSALFHPGVWKAKPETVTVHDFVIRDYLGIPIDGFTIQTSAGQTKIPIHMVKEIRSNGRIHRETKDIDKVQNVVRAEIVLTNGKEMSVVMNADFGTIEGKTKLGDFFLKDPHTIRRLVFNRYAKRPEAPKKVEVEKAAPPPDTDGDGVPDSNDKCPGTPRGVRVDENGCPPDTDGDGVPDYKDRCPGTPKGAPVNSVGCWAIKGINFDYDKWDIKPQYYGTLDENVHVLKMNPTFKVEIQGHTDGIGSEQYNQPLSEKRAESAKAYFVSKGISAKRISTRGFGESRPIVPNDTPEGRAQNRRIEIKLTSR